MKIGNLMINKIMKRVRKMKVRDNILISSIITILILGGPLIVSAIELDSGGGEDSPTHVNVALDITKIHLWDDGDAIAVALANKPPIILADEPTGNIDVENSRVVYELLSEMCYIHNTTLLLASHDPDAANFVDREILLSKLKSKEL